MADTPGELVGYRVLSTLGTGAASTIYEVLDPEEQRRYALKQLHKLKPSDQRFVDQAVNEHAVSSQFDHPLLRRSYRLIRKRSFSLRTTQVLLLMELIEGQTLDIVKPNNMVDLIRIFQSVAVGLQHMHAAGVVHADLKPINILITPGMGVKIIDFGQSCPIGTVKERIQGTADFMAPEQARLNDITIATDSYNLGATMFWCVTEHHVPRPGRRRGGIKALRQIGKVAPPDPREINPAVPPALSTLILDCLRRNPSDRPANMDEVLGRFDMAMFQLERERSSPAVGEA